MYETDKDPDSENLPRLPESLSEAMEALQTGKSSPENWM